MGVNTHVQDLLSTTDGIVALRNHPELYGQLRWYHRTGELVRMLPGVYALPHVAAHLEGRIHAVALWSRDAVVSGRTAARYLFWPDLKVPVVDVANVEYRGQQPGYRFSERRIPPELIAELRGWRLTTPALTALDLCAVLGGAPIDEVLRARRATLADLHRAFELCPGRVGNRRRLQLLIESRDEPWSEAERLAHVLLHDARITGWRPNYPVRVGGQRYFIDIAFVGIRLAIEIDGREVHSGPDAFEADRQRQNALVAAGWRVLRFTWRMLEDDPAAVLAAIRHELRRTR